MKTIKFLSIVLVASLTFMSCSDDDNPTIVNEEEVITTARLTLIPIGSGDTVVFESLDIDGDGPGVPVNTVTGSINANSQYIGAVEFLNELENPAEDITEEVSEEDDEHQVFFSFTGGSNSSITYSDADDNGNPVGLSVSFNSGSAATGNTLTLTLKHEPAKPNDGTANGAGGETDVEATFTYDVN